jgi:PD-(D/E)XK nuclease superfamily
VCISLNEALIYAYGLPGSTSLKLGTLILEALMHNQFEVIERHLKSLYASIPFDWYRKNPISNYEGHYASIFYSHFVGLGLSVTVEDSCSTGRVDMVVDFNHCIYVFEFKVVADTPTGAALAQIKTKNYAQKYVKDNKFVYLIGVEFSKMQKQIVAFEVERCL